MRWGAGSSAFAKTCWRRSLTAAAVARRPRITCRNTPPRSGRNGSAPCRCPGLEGLAHLAVHDALLIIALRIDRDHAPPEAHGRGIAQVFGDFPAPREAVEDEL